MSQRKKWVDSIIKKRKKDKWSASRTTQKKMYHFN